MAAGPLVEGSVLHETYELLSPLGRGGMGVVWRARHVRLPRELAIKVLNDAAYENEEVLQRFRREAEITSQLGHPHIVQVFDFNVLPTGEAYLVMELLQGESLRERLQRSPMTVEETLEIVGQVGSALVTAHRAGIVHRDLKPENIFLCRNPGPTARPLAKVLDFGISKIQGSMTVLTQDSSLLGTPKYMSPEQAKGENTTLDARTDQFALAAIAYEMLTGEAAFSGSNVTSVLLKVLNEDPRPPHEVRSDLPAALGNAIRRGLSKNRDERFPTLEAFVQAVVHPSDTFPDPATPTLEDTLQSGSAEALSVPPALTSAPGVGSVPEALATPPPSAAFQSAELTGGHEGTLQPPPPPASNRNTLLLAAVGAMVAAAAITTVVLIWSGPRELTSVPLAQVEPPALEGEASAGPAAEPEPAEDPSGPRGGDEDPDRPEADPDPPSAGSDSDPPETQSGEGRPDAPTRPDPRRPRPAVDPFEGLPPPLRQALAAVKEDPIRAETLAVRAMGQVGRTPQAFAVATVTACAQRDLGKANSYMANVPRRQRRFVRRRCAGVGLEL